MIDRRHFLMLLLGIVALNGNALADDDGDSGGGGGGNSGHGGGNSSSGGGDDDDDDGDDDRDDDDDDDDDDHDRARKARERGDAQSLLRILAMARKKYGGRIIDVRLRRRSGQLFYDIKLLSADGLVRRLRLDARTGRSITGTGS